VTGALFNLSENLLTFSVNILKRGRCYSIYEVLIAWDDGELEVASRSILE